MTKNTSPADRPRAMPSFRRIRRVSDWLEGLGRALAPIAMRVALALPFLRSGLTRWDDFPSLSYATLYLFEEQFRLHLFGRLYALPVPDTLALLVAIAEIVLPILLLLGVATRFASLGLLLMTGVIQLVVPEGWANFHLYWAALALGILALGPGRLSIDRLVASGWRRR